MATYTFSDEILSSRYIALPSDGVEGNISCLHYKALTRHIDASLCESAFTLKLHFKKVKD